MTLLALVFSLALAQTVAVESVGEPTPAAAAPSLTLGNRVPTAERLMLARFSDCVVRAYPKQVEEAVLGWPVDPKSVNVLRQIDTGRCLRSVQSDVPSFRIQPSLMRYALADALARSRSGKLDISSVSQAPALIHPTVDEAKYRPAPGEVFDESQRKLKEELRASFANFIALSQLGECVVRKDASNALSLLGSEPGSADEQSAFRAAMPVLNGCAAGSAIRADRIAVRGEIGTALLRMADPSSRQKKSKAS